MSKLNSSYSKINRLGSSMAVTVSSFTVMIYILTHSLFQIVLFLYYSVKSLFSKRGLVMSIILTVCFIIDSANLLICWCARSRGVVHKFLKRNRRRVEGSGRVMLSLKTLGIVIYMKFFLFKIGPKWLDKLHGRVTEPTLLIVIDSVAIGIFFVWGMMNFRGFFLLTSRRR
eukprot:GAHX01001411.1.p1 GENE.GAHX01001411.1~~GAHX01001411.1.p1  ORF type:complete len:171 (+),score=4.49 GAHX01001411.1:142-654(+)